MDGAALEDGLEAEQRGAGPLRAGQEAGCGCGTPLKVGDTGRTTLEIRTGVWWLDCRTRDKWREI